MVGLPRVNMISHEKSKNTQFFSGQGPHVQGVEACLEGRPVFLLTLGVRSWAVLLCLLTADGAVGGVCMSAHVHSSNVGGRGLWVRSEVYSLPWCIVRESDTCIVNYSITDAKYVVSQGTFLPSKARAGGTRPNNFMEEDEGSFWDLCSLNK